jgi:flagellar assembly protein FliH
VRTSLVIEMPAPLQAVEIVRSDDQGDDAAPGASPRSAKAQAAAIQEAERRLEEERQRLVQAREALEAAAQAVADLEAEAIRGAEQQLVDLALAIACKVLAQEIDNGRYRVEPIVQEALRQAPSRREVVVHLNPQDLAQCQQGQAAPGNVRLVADVNVRRGECTVETAEGTVPATVVDRMEQVAAALKSPA